MFALCNESLQTNNKWVNMQQKISKIHEQKTLWQTVTVANDMKKFDPAKHQGIIIERNNLYRSCMQNILGKYKFLVAG